MIAMRAAFVLATILCLAAPPLSWATTVDVSSPLAASLSIGSQATCASQVIRAIAKTDKSFSFGCALAAEAPSVLLPICSYELVAASKSEPPNLDLQGPPLAPRPPPLS